MAEVQATRTPNGDQLDRFRDLMSSARESRSEGNADAGEAREILKGLGFGAASIAMYKRLTDMSEEIGGATFEELCQLLDADPKFPFSTGKPNLFADAAVKEAKKKPAKATAKDKAPAAPSADPAAGSENGAAKANAKLGKGDAKGALKGAIPVEEAMEQARQHLGTDQQTALN